MSALPSPGSQPQTVPPPYPHHRAEPGGGRKNPATYLFQPDQASLCAAHAPVQPRF